MSGLLPIDAALRTLLALRRRTVVLRDRHGELTGGDLLDLVRLHRSHPRRSAARHGLAQLPPTAPLRQVLVTALSGHGVLELRSSGTTGRPRTRRRGPLTPAQLRLLRDAARRVGLRRGQRIATVTPGVHRHGLMVALGALALRSTLVDLTHLPAAERAELLQRSAPDVLTGIPVQLEALLHAHRSLGGEPPLRIAQVISGSDTLTPALRDELAEHFGARVHDVYSTSETGPLTVDGVPLRGVQLRLEDSVLHARTPFTGRRERITDRAQIAGDGTVTVLGRADTYPAMMGMLQDPAAVVRVLVSADGVASARLRVVPDERYGVRTVAEVELEEPAAGEQPPGAQTLRALVRDHLGAASVPREVRLSGPGGPDLSSPGR